MGNYRFRLSDMIPNAWFYKLKDMSKSRNQQKIIYHHHGSKKKPHHNSSSSFSSSSSSSFSSTLSSRERQQQQQRQLSHQRKSYYFSRDLSTPAAAPPPQVGAEPDVRTSSYDINVETKARISDGNYPEPQRKSYVAKKRRSTRRNRVSNSSRSSSSPCCRGRVVTSSVAAAGCSCRETVESVWTKPDSTTAEDYPISPPDISSEDEEASLPEFGSNNPCSTPETFDTMLSWSSTTYCRGKLQDKDIIMDIGNQPLIAKSQKPAADKGDGLATVSQINLPPIITNHHQSGKTSRKKMETLQSTEPTKARRNGSKLEERKDCGSVKEDISSPPKRHQKVTPAPARRSSANSSQGLKLRTNSPRIVNRRRIQGRKSVSFSSNTSNNSSRRSISESFAVVKSSKDPQRDFRDSMVEMIMENNLCASKDLEDLLACYLSLNSDEYHDLIISVFKKIWFDIIDNIHHPK